MKHFYGLLNFKKSFKNAQLYHQHAVKNGNDATKQFHLEAHIKAISEGNITTAGIKTSPKNMNKGG